MDDVCHRTTLVTCPVTSRWLCCAHGDKQINRIRCVVLVCNLGVGRGGGGNHHHCNTAAARIVGLALLLDVRCACDDRGGADLRLSGASQPRNYWLRAFPRSIDHHGGQNGWRIDAAAGNYLLWNYRAERSGGCLCRRIPRKESDGGDRIKGRSTESCANRRR